MPLLLILTVALFAAAHSQPASYANCDRTFLCGPINNATFPFTGGDRPSYCGLPEFALTCRDNTIAELTHKSVPYRVLRLDQAQKSLNLARSDLYNNACPSQFRNTDINATHFSYNVPQNEDLTLFYGCNTSLVNSTADNFPPNNYFSCNSTGLNFTDAFYLIGPLPNDPILGIISCGTSVKVPMLTEAGDQLTRSQMSLGEALMQGFDVSYSVRHDGLCSECNRLGGQCGFNDSLDQLICICGDRPCPFTVSLPRAPSPDDSVGGSYEGTDRAKEIITIVSVIISGAMIISIIICCFLKRRHSQNNPKQKCNRDVENLLLQHGSLAPKRYQYSEIKKITKSLSDKLGQGGYGSVYKGMLPDGRLVAVKILIEMESNGEEFINEVVSISRTSHVNIVTLLGFCYEGNMRALVYEFMPNKSLDKFLGGNGDCFLDLKKLYEIAVGVAQGLQYLHTGCTTRIVHFDIKPQNILLDEEFCPKISDFGLAKLCKKKQSILSVMGTRGTIGYIAPEVFSRNFGGVSHKSDVYSYGMMLLEMAGAKEIVDINGASAVQSSENYFPDKIYEQIIIDVANNVNDSTMEEEKKARKKMSMVGFWCIQTIPSERPSISKVVEMLEGSVESIQIPPKPVLFCRPLNPDQEPSSENSPQD
ncbi:hypothetical protein C2S51_036787 [Perilla frutescens var. frutescens]|nr:hypothetical protein C2S51_036787 [Perilla frutescens var. frutescens]